MRFIRSICLLVTVSMCLLTGCSDSSKEEKSKNIYLLVGVDEEFFTQNDTPDLKIDFEYNDDGLITRRTDTKHNDEPYVYMENTYDSTGRLLRQAYPALDQEITYDEGGNILMSRSGDTVHSYTYDSHGNTLSEKTDQAGKITYEYYSTCEYDDNGLLIRKENRAINHETQYENQHETLYKYDMDGQLIHECVIEENGLESNTYYSYDENGNRISIESVSYYGAREISTYLYDKENRILKQIVQNPEHTWVTDMSYSDEGDIVEMQHYQDDILLITTEYTYGDIPGQKLCISVDYGRSQTTDCFTYDKDGNVLTRQFTDGFGKTYTYKFRYITMRVPVAFCDAVQKQQNSLIEEFLNEDHTIISD